MRFARHILIGLVAVLVASACGEPASNDGEPAVASDPAEPPAASQPPANPPTDPVVDRPEPDSPDAADLAAGLNAFGYELFSVAAASEDDVVLSPLSIGIAFGMADAGASDATAEILADMFAYPVDGEARWSAFNTLEQSVTDVGEPEVRLANRMFPDTGFTPSEGYSEVLGRWFGAGMEPLALQADSDASRDRINAWVADQTEDLIPELLAPGSIDSSSVLVLVNALYLEAQWASPFDEFRTQDSDFTRLDGSTVTVPLMQDGELSGPAVATADYAATEIPYEGGELSMLVVVPAEDRYAEVEARLDADLIAEIDGSARQAPVELWLPRFESDAVLDLREAIEGSLGIEGLFGTEEWEGIGEGIWLESAVHAADISVDEEGTVAAAATALDFDTSGPPDPEIVVRADRPFLYLIRHVPTGAVLFVGRVLDPST